MAATAILKKKKCYKDEYNIRTVQPIVIIVDKKVASVTYFSTNWLNKFFYEIQDGGLRHLVNEQSAITFELVNRVSSYLKRSTIGDVYFENW